MKGLNGLLNQKGGAKLAILLAVIYFVVLFTTLSFAGVIDVKSIIGKFSKPKEKAGIEEEIKKETTLTAGAEEIVSEEKPEEVETGEAEKVATKTAQAEITATAEADMEQLKKVVKIYEAMDAKKAADIISQLDDDEAVELLSYMNEEIAAEILAEMELDKAAILSRKIRIP